MSISFLFVLFSIGLTVGVISLIILLWRKGGGAGKIILSILLLAPISILAAILFLRGWVSSNPPAGITESVVQLEPITSNASQLEDISFPANTYPSIELAAEALARRALEMLPDLVPNNETPEIIQIWGDIKGQSSPVSMSNDTLTVAGAVFRDEGHIEKVNIETVTNDWPGDGISNLYPNGVTVRLRLEESSITNTRLPWDKSPEMYITDGTLSMHLWGKKGSVTLTQRFIHKPWAADFAAFVSRHPQQRWIRAVSGQLVTNEFEAQESARQMAVAQLRPLVRLPAGTTNPDVKIELILDDNTIVDRFVQRFARPYGDVYRAMLLIDAAPQTIAAFEQDMAKTTASAQSHMRRSWAGHLASLAGLFVLICVVYVFLNAATRGYYVWSLRIAAIVLALIGAAMIYIHLRSAGNLP